MYKFVEHGALAIALVSALIAPLCLMGCSADKSGKVAEVMASLSATASKDGVSFLIDPSWKNSLDSNYGGLEPCSANKITADTFTDGRGGTLESIEDAGLLGSPDGYEQDGSFDIADGASVKYYASESDGNLYSVAIGHNGVSGTGSMVFFNRGSRAKPGVPDDGTYEKTFSFYTVWR